MFLQANNKNELFNTVSSLNSNKTSALNSIRFRILFLLKNEISKQLVNLFNFSFKTVVFPSVLKTRRERLKTRL